MERQGEGAYFKADPNMQRPPEKHSCVERKRLGGTKLPPRMKSASGQVGAAPAKPLTAAAQQLFGGRATGKGAAYPATPRPPQGPASLRPGVSGMCYFEQRFPLPSPAGWRRWQGMRRGPWVRGYPNGLQARPREAGLCGGGRGRGAQR